MPRRPVHPVKLLLDEHGNVLLDIVLLQCGRSGIHSALLHVLRHCSIQDSDEECGQFEEGDNTNLEEPRSAQPRTQVVHTHYRRS